MTFDEQTERACWRMIWACWRMVLSTVEALKKAREHVTDEKTLLAINNALADVDEAAQVMEEDCGSGFVESLRNLLKT